MTEKLTPGTLRTIDLTELVHLGDGNDRGTWQSKPVYVCVVCGKLAEQPHDISCPVPSVNTHAVAWEADLAELARLRKLVEKQRAVVERSKALDAWFKKGVMHAAPPSNLTSGLRQTLEVLAALEQSAEEERS